MPDAGAVGYTVDLIVRPRDGVRDPQGEAVEEALGGLGHRVNVACTGRFLRMVVPAESEADARRVVEDACRRLLVNPNIETHELSIRPAREPVARVSREPAPGLSGA